MANTHWKTQCAHCHEIKTIHGRRLCTKCTAALKAGRVPGVAYEDYPTRQELRERRNQAIMEEFNHFTKFMSDANAVQVLAPKFDVSTDWFVKYLRRSGVDVDVEARTLYGRERKRKLHAA